MTHLFMEALEQNLFQDNKTNPHGGIKMDFTNMFNSISRQATYEELKVHFPELCHIYTHLYPPTGNLIWTQKPDGKWTNFIQPEGFAQGCPLSPFLSCLPLNRLLANLQIALKNRPVPHPTTTTRRTAAFMDDTGAVLPLSDIAFAFKFIANNGPPKGLHLSTDKCELLLATNGDNPLPYLHPRLAQELQQVADTYCKGKINSDGLTLLGIPIGSGTFMNNFLINKLDDLQNTLTSIKEHVQSPATKM